MSGGGVKFSVVGTRFLAIFAVVAVVGGAVVLGKRAYEQKEAKRKGAALAAEEAGARRQLAEARSQAEHRGAMERLDGIQQRHVEFTTWLHERDLDLPIPDSDGLSVEEYRRVQADWRLVRGRSGQIQVDSEAGPAFEAGLRAMHAKLLAGPSGRALLGKVLHPEREGTKPIRIEPLEPDPATREQREARVRNRKWITDTHAALEREREQLEAASQDGEERLTEELERRSAQYQEDRDAFQERAMELNDRQELEAPNPGLASESGEKITVREGLRDAELFCYGEDDRPIPAPAFLIYGHELVHAARRRLGIERVLDLNGLDPKWGNQEENQTIAGDDRVRGLSENAIRNDHGLPRRRYVQTGPWEEIALGLPL